MTEINRLTSVDSLNGGDSIPLYDQSNGDARRTSVTTLTNHMQNALSFGAFIPQYSTQYFAPSSNGFTATITDGSNNIHLILTPNSTLSSGTIVLPPSTSAVDKQLVMLNSTQAVTALTVTSSGASVTGEPSGLSANDFFTLKYDATTQTWYRIG